MSDVVIRVENLSKLYRIGQRERYKTLRESLIDCLRAPLRAVSAVVGRGSEVEHQRLNSYIWALKDVSFEVKQGEVIGIIGRNGAGKSTLLKILSRITKPTNGYAEIRGQVGSLLEVGTGFHPELTGRENMYLSGAILGMKKAEIERQFDQIVSFAEIEKFIDTPLKRYSSGMYVRLAFAVAAHLEPEILLVDEVLAVGDAAFQKKCVRKMDEVSGEGRTILLVSHNMGAIESLCNRAILLEEGQIALSGDTKKVVSFYVAKNYQQSGNPFSKCVRTGNGKLRIVSFRMESPEGGLLQQARSGEPVLFSFQFENHGCDSRDRVSLSFSVHTEREFGLFHYYSHFSGVYFEKLPRRGFFKCLIPELPLAPGNYLVMCRAVMGDQNTGEEVDWPRVFMPISVVGGDFYGTGNANLSSWGPILVKGRWWMAAGSET